MLPEADLRQFLSQAAPLQHVELLLLNSPGVSFFVKDKGGRIMVTNERFRERFGQGDDILGRTDRELFPLRLAENFRRDDLEVMSTGEPKLHIVELFFNRQGIPDWYITNKMPLRSTDGAVIGVMGTVQGLGGSEPAETFYGQIGPAIDYIREHFREKISVAKLSTLAGLSHRQFDRRFKDAVGSAPQAFIIKMRVQAACDRLRDPSAQIGDVALELGFYDQSAFTLQFRKHVGMTPLRYQRSFRSPKPG